MESRRDFFLATERMGFSHWGRNDEVLTHSLWGNPMVTRYICASGVFTKADIRERLLLEIGCQEEHGVQYWPIFHRESGMLIGCCGLHPHGDEYELGFHLIPDWWGEGYATEAAKAVIDYAFETMKVTSLFAGHHPKNEASKRVLTRLGFEYTGDELYRPTGLMHPSYRMVNTFKERRISVQTTAE